MGKLDGLELYSPWPFQGQSIKVKGNLQINPNKYQLKDNQPYLT